jgi:hypothetical protein
MTEPLSRVRRKDISGYIGPNGDWRPGASTCGGVWNTNNDNLLGWAAKMTAEVAMRIIGDLEPDDIAGLELAVVSRAILNGSYAVRNEPSKRGSYLHDCMEEAIVTGKPKSRMKVELGFSGSGVFWEGARQFLKDYPELEVVLTETTCHHPTLPISGMGDALVKLGPWEGLMWIDWKFSKRSSFEYSIWKHLTQATGLAACEVMETPDGLQPLPKADWVATAGFHEDGTYSLYVHPANDLQILQAYIAGAYAVITGIELNERSRPPEAPF